MATLRSFINDLDQLVQQTKMNNALKIATGSLPNMEQYHRACGRLEGMDVAVKAARDMLGQLEAAAEEGSSLPEMPKVDDK